MCIPDLVVRDLLVVVGGLHLRRQQAVVEVGLVPEASGELDHTVGQEEHQEKLLEIRVKV